MQDDYELTGDGRFLWTDANADGVVDPGELADEPLANGVEVTIYRLVPDGAGGWEYDDEDGASPVWSRTVTTDFKTVDGAPTDLAGYFQFDDLVTQKYIPAVVDGAGIIVTPARIVVCGYQLRITDERFENRQMGIAKYQRGNYAADPTETERDSDLRYIDGFLMNRDKGEVDVLLEPAEGTSAASNVMLAPHAKNPIVLHAGETGSVAYDLALGADRADNDGGIRELAPYAIAGFVWNDADYDGVFEGNVPHASEAGIDGKQVILKQYYWQPGAVEGTGEWVHNPDFAYPTGLGADAAGADAAAAPVAAAAASGSTSAVLTQGGGAYLFEGVPVYVLKDGAYRMAGYTLEVKGGADADAVNGLPTTLVEAHSPAAEAFNSKGYSAQQNTIAGYDAGNYPIYWSDYNAQEMAPNGRDVTKSVLEGKLVLAAKAVLDGPHMTQPQHLVTVQARDAAGNPIFDDAGNPVTYAFDTSLGQDELRMNAGFGPYQLSKIQGVVWDDANYDGLRNFAIDGFDDGSVPTGVDATVSEEVIPGAVVRLTQWYLDGGTWVKVAPERFSMEAVTSDRDDAAAGLHRGVYTFEGVPSYVGIKRDGTVVQPYAHDADGKRTDGFAAEAADTDDIRLASYTVEFVGLKKAETGDGGTVTETLVGRDDVIATRMHAALSVDGDLVDATRFDSDLRPDGKPADAASGAVAAADIRLYEQYEPEHGRILVATEVDVTGRMGQYDEDGWGGVAYDPLLAVEQQRGGDAGLVEIPTGSLAGRVWDDADYDGVQDADEDGVFSEPGLEGETVRVTRWYYDGARTNDADGGSHWFRDETFGFADAGGTWHGYYETTTDAEGAYEFAGVPTAVVLPGDDVRLAAYRVELAEVRNADGTAGARWMLTRSHQGASEQDSDALSEDERGVTGGIALTVRGGNAAEPQLVERQLIVAAPAQHETAVADSRVAVEVGEAVGEGSAAGDAPGVVSSGAGVYDWRQVAKMSDGETAGRDGADVGELAPVTHRIEGVIWHDADNDGIQNDEDDDIVNGLAVMLERYVYMPGDGAAATWKSDPAWNASDHVVATAPMALPEGERNGVFAFEGLDTHVRDASGNVTVYGYKVKLIDERVMGADFRTREFVVAKRHQGNDGALDSDLRLEDGYLVAIDEGEMIVLLQQEEATSQPSNLVTVAAGDAGAAAASTMVLDVALGRDAYDSDGGILPIPTRVIAGDVWFDSADETMVASTDYDGIKDASEAGIPGKTVRLVQWAYDDAVGAWQRLGERTTTTWAEARDGERVGHYEFVDCPVLVAVETGYKLAGYTLELAGGEGDDAMNAVPATLLRVGTPHIDYDAVNSKAVSMNDVEDGGLWQRGTYPIAWAEEHAFMTIEGGDAGEAAVADGNAGDSDDGAADSDGGADGGAGDGADDGVSAEPVHKQVLDSRIVLAKSVDAASYGGNYLFQTERGAGEDAVSFAYDLIDGQDERRMHAGFVPFEPDKAASVRGVVWDDRNYDGVRAFETRIDTADAPPVERIDGEDPIAGVEMRLTQYYVAAPGEVPEPDEGTEPGGSNDPDGPVVRDGASEPVEPDEPTSPDGSDSPDDSDAPATVALMQNRAFGDRDEETGELLGYQVALTDDEGVYEFTKLPSYVGVAYDEGGNAHVLQPSQFDLRTLIVREGEAAADDVTKVDHIRLCLYRVELVQPEETAASRHHVASAQVRFDSDLDHTETADDQVLYEQYVSADRSVDLDDMTNARADEAHLRQDGFIVVAAPTVPGSQYEAEYQGIVYDIPRPLLDNRGGDAGLVTVIRTSSIEGRLWVDADVDGIRTDGESPFTGAEIVLQRYWYDVAAETWVIDEEATQTTVPDPDGTWRFDGLETTSFSLADQHADHVVYGYEVRASNIDENYTLTFMNQGTNPLTDSDLSSATLRFQPDVAVEGMIVLATAATADESVVLRIPGPAGIEYSAVGMRTSVGNDAGFVPYAVAAIRGIVWEDADHDGVRAAGEAPIAGVPMSIDRYYWNGDGWTFDDAFAIDSMTSDVNGEWVFGALRGAGRVEGEDGTWASVAYGYRVHALELPEKYEVSILGAVPDGAVDSDLDEMTARIVPDEAHGGLIVLAAFHEAGSSELLQMAAALSLARADSAGEGESSGEGDGGAPGDGDDVTPGDGSGEPGDDVVPGDDENPSMGEDAPDGDYGIYAVGPEGSWSMVEAHDSDNNDAGLVPYGLASISGWVFDDSDGDGVQDAASTPMAGHEVILERRSVAFDAADRFGSTGSIDSDRNTNLDAEGEPIGGGFARGLNAHGPLSAAALSAYGISSPVAERGTSALAATGELDSMAGYGEPTAWTEVGRMEATAEGLYEFSELELMDAEGNPYEYRVRSTLPEGYAFVPKDASEDENLDSDWESADDLASERDGATDALMVVGPRDESANVYGITHKMTEPFLWMRDRENSVDLGMTHEDVANSVTPLPNTNPATMVKAGDEIRLLAALVLTVTAFILLFVAVIRRRAPHDRQRSVR